MTMPGTKRRTALAAPLFGLLFASAFVAGSEPAAPAFPAPAAEDLRVENVKGNFTRKNFSGGFLLEKIAGDCDVSSSGGSITARAITGDLTAFTDRGDIELAGIAGQVRAVTKGGNVSIKDVGDRVYAETLMGEIVIETAPRVEARNTLGGDVKIVDVAGYSSVSARGNILLVMTRDVPESRICDLATTEGDITIVMPARAAADVEIRMPISKDSRAETRIESDFAMKKFDQKLVEDGRTLLITTVINGGGKKISLNIARGNVYFKARD